jgi:hypothetical protein
MAVLGDITPRVLVEIDRRFRCAYSRHYQGNHTSQTVDLYRPICRNVP